MAPRVQIVEDDRAVRRALAALLEGAGIAVEAYPSGEAFLEAALGPGRGAEVGCVLLDLHLPGRDGLAVLAALRAEGVPTPVVMLTGHGDVATAVRAMREGAADFIEKPFDGDLLIARLTALIADGAGGPAGETAFADLTPREREVLREVVAGRPNKLIAHRLGLSPKTVEAHRARVMRKSGARSLAELVRIALAAGIDRSPGTG